MGFESGGLADKLGNRYEGRWVAKQLLRLLNEEIQSIIIEAVGDDERGVDLWIEQNDGIKQAQQCKARNRSEESWSINDLKARNIFYSAKFQLAKNANRTFALISAVGAQTFHDLCESARNSNQNPQDFYTYQVEAAGRKRREAFRQFCNAINVNPEDPSGRGEAFEYLARIYFVLYPDDHDNWQNLQAEARYLLTGAPEATISTLIAYAENNYAFRRTIYADALRRHLETLGIYPKRLAHDERIVPAIEELQRQFEESIAPNLILNNIIPREETKRLLQFIHEGKDAVLHGAAGNGKSAVLYGLTKYLQTENIPFLPIRLDRRDAKNTAVQFGCDMGLPDSPVDSLIALTGDRPCVLLLDQLDAIRWTSSHSANALDICKELLREIKYARYSGKKITAVLSCRSFDLENDPEIRNWLADDKNLEKVEVTSFSLETLGEILGSSFSQLTNRQKRILACPQNLAMWMTLKKENFIPQFRSVTELMRCFWINRREALERVGIAMPELDNVIYNLLNEVEKTGNISVSIRILSHYPKISRALQSYGILQESNGKLTFCHQSYLDYLIADRLMQQISYESGDIINWLGSKERQSLFCREQLRQALSMLNEELPSEFVSAIRRILESNKIRFHMKHVVLEFIGQLDEISEELRDYCFSLLQDDYWKKHVIETVCLGHSAYVRLLIEGGIVIKWLNSDIEDDINLALWLLQTVNDKIPDEVTMVLESFMAKGEPWLTRILTTLCWNVADDSDKMFDLRLKLVRRSVIANYINWQALCKQCPLRAVELIEVFASTWSLESFDAPAVSKASSAPMDQVDKLYDEDFKSMKTVAKNHPLETWDSLVPHISRLTEFRPTPQNDHGLGQWQEDRFERVHNYIDIRRGMVELVIAAGGKLAAESPEELIVRTTSLENHISLIIQEILAGVYAHLPPRYADVGIRWLLAAPSRLQLGSGYYEVTWMPAVRIVKLLSPHCSEAIFRELEAAIIHFHSPDEKRLAKHYLHAWRDGYFDDYWGRAQYFLIPALDPWRILPATLSLMAVLKRKYDSYGKDRFLRIGKGQGGWIGSKLDKSLDRISDRSWLAIIEDRNLPLNHNQRQQVDKDHAVTSTIRQFSSSLGKIAKRFPERFGQIALRLSQNIHPYYVSAIFDGLAMNEPHTDVPAQERDDWSPAVVATVEAVLAKFRAGDDRDSAMSFCRLIRTRAKENWSDAVIARLISYAIHHSDLAPGQLNMHCDNPARDATVQMLFDNTINCVRGCAAEAIGALLWTHTDWLDKLSPGIEALVHDPHPSVRMAVIDALLPVINIDKDRAVKWFCLACDSDLRVAASPRAVLFFNSTFNSHAEQLILLVRAMINSPFDEVCQDGAEEVTARWLFQGLFEKDLKICLGGSLPQRKGVARVAAHFLYDGQYASPCQELIIPLINDPEKDVRAEAAKLSRNPAFFQISKGFVNIYINSKAYVDDPSGIIYDLKNFSGSILPLSSIIFDICVMLSTTLREESRNIALRISHSVSDIYSLLLRLYEQAEGINNAKIRDQCMDIWDMLFEKRVGMIHELTKAIEK